MNDSLSILSYISRTSPSILTSVHNAMDKIYKSLIAHGYEACDWDTDQINEEVARLLENTWYNPETCKYAIMMETSLIAIASNISDAVFEYSQTHKHANVIGFESYNTFIQYFEKAAMLDSKYRSVANAYYHMQHDLIRHGFAKWEIFRMMQDIIQEHSVICNQYERFFRNKSEKASDHPTITLDPDKKANRIGIHLVKNNTDSNPDKIELFDATDYDEGNPEVGKFPDWLREELQEIQDLQDSSDDDDEELTPEELEKLTPEELIDRIMKIITTRDEDDEEDDDELTQEELIDHAMVCLMDQIDDKIESEVERKFYELSPQYRSMKSRFIFEYPALASILFGFPF